MSNDGASGVSADAGAVAANGGGVSAGTQFAFASVTTLFFAWGFITSLIDPLVSAVKGIFSLSDFEAQLSASAFFIAYGVMSLPAAALLARRKSVATVLIALVTMIAGCMLMLVAANVAIYALVLLGLFILASGITILQVAANPLAAALGSPERSHFRLTLSQAFNSLGTFIGPYLGALLFLKGVEIEEGEQLNEAVRQAALIGIDAAFLWIAVLIGLLALFIWFARRLIAGAMPQGGANVAHQSKGAMLGEVAASRWALLGGAAIFLYVGAEVAIGSFIVNYLMQDHVLNLPEQDAGKLISLYWGGALVGRFIGSAVLRMVSPGLTLTAVAAGAITLIAISANTTGVVAGYTLLAVGLMNAIMFPTIFSLACEKLGPRAADGSGMINVAIAGGAIIPPMYGALADATSLAFALVLPAACYAIIAGFGFYARRPA